MSDRLHTLSSPAPGCVIGIEVEPGQAVAAGQVLATLESMKMELALEAPTAGIVEAVWAAVGEVVQAGQPLLRLREGEAAALAAPPPAAPAPRADLQRLEARRARLDDAARPQAIARRHAQCGRSARENVADLVDAGSFAEYGAFAVAAQRRRRSVDDLQANTPADGVITGVATVNAALFGAERARCAVLAYDATVLAGTQGVFGHMKCDRLLEVAARLQLPVVWFAEGGGGRPGDVDWPIVAGLDCTTFARFAALAGQVPRIAIVHGRCFAGNAALAGSADWLIATRASSLGLGGPAMIEGGGLGVVAADDVGPSAVMAANGVIDLLVDDEAAAVRAAKQLLAFTQGDLPPVQPGADAAALRDAVPANRNAAYDVRRVVEALADRGSVLELRRGFGHGVVTALARVDGMPVGIAANHVHHLGGALDAAACDKLARFMQWLDAFGLPLVTLVDTPGFMVGPASEQTAMVRKAGRLFVTAAALRVPVFSVVLRRGYGLGAMAMTGGHFHAPMSTVAWPGAEFGPMGLEGAVKLGFRKELDAAGDGRDALFAKLLAEARERGDALNMASALEIDAVIDPAETRAWLVRALRAARGRPLPPRRAFVDAW